MCSSLLLGLGTLPTHTRAYTHTFQSSFFHDHHVTAETPPPVYDDRSEASGLDNSPVGLPGSFIGSSGENLSIACIVSYCVSAVYILYGVCVHACVRVREMNTCMHVRR